MFAGIPLSTITSLSNTYIQINTSVAPYNSGNVVVYLAPTNTGVTVNVVDIGGSTEYFYDNSYSIIVSTTTGSFTDGFYSKSITIPYGSITLTSITSNTWAPVYNDIITSSIIQTVSSLYISTNIKAPNYTNIISTTLYGNLITSGNIEVTGALMLGRFSTFTVGTMSNTLYNLATTSSYVSSLTFLSSMSNLGSLPDPYISTTTLDTVYKNLGTYYTYISTSRMQKELGILSTVYISSLNQLNTQLSNTTSLIYNSNGVMTTNSSITVNKWYGVSTVTLPDIYQFNAFIVDMVFDGTQLYILTDTTLYSYTYTTSANATTVITNVFTNANAMSIYASIIYVCDSPKVWKVVLSPSATTTFITATGIVCPAIFYNGTYIYIYVKPAINQTGNINIYDLTGSLTRIILSLNKNDICTGLIVPTVGALSGKIYISSELQLYIYDFNTNHVDWYSLNGYMSDGNLTNTQYNVFPVAGNMYIDNVCRTNSIKCMKIYGDTLYFIDGTTLRTLNIASVPVVNGNSVSGYSIISRALSEPVGSSFAANGSLTVIWTYDNLNQYYRNISLPAYTVATQPFVTNGPIYPDIIDMVFDSNGFLYILTSRSLYQYSFSTNTYNPAFRGFYFTKATHIKYRNNILYICDYSAVLGKTFVWAINTITLSKINIVYNPGIYPISNQITASYILNNYMFFFTIVGTPYRLFYIDLISGSVVSTPFTSTTQVTSATATDSNIFVCDITGNLRIYDITQTSSGTLLHTTVTGQGIIDGYFDGRNTSYAFTNTYSLQSDLDGTIYTTDTHCVRKCVYNNTTKKGQLVTIAGTTAGITDGDGDLATLTVLSTDAMAIQNRTAYITDNTRKTSGRFLRVITPSSGNDRLYANFVSTATTVVTGYTISNFIGHSSGMSATSDIRLKEGVEPLLDSLEKVSRLQGVEYRKIGEDILRIGCIAQDVEREYPAVIDERTDGMKGIFYEHLTAPLVESIKELRRRVKQIESRARHISL